jgi:hypothetical protein
MVSPPPKEGCGIWVHRRRERVSCVLDLDFDDDIEPVSVDDVAKSDPLVFPGIEPSDSIQRHGDPRAGRFSEVLQLATFSALARSQIARIDCAVSDVGGVPWYSTI